MTVVSESNRPLGTSTPTAGHDRSGVDLYWIPLGAGGAGFIRFNGLVYEAIKARLEGRRPLDLYHAALEVHVPESRYVLEMTPIPADDPKPRGVVFEGPVGSHWLAGLRVFRYEVRRWRSGVIPDVGEAVASPQRLSHDPEHALRLLDLVDAVPPLVWGRDRLGVGDMWSSNSVISWLLARSGLPVERIRPPKGGRAPGWMAGVIVAHRFRVSQDDTARLPASGVAKPPPARTHGRGVDSLVGENPSDQRLR